MNYPDVITRFLRNDERMLPVSNTMYPFVIEAKEQKSFEFLKNFLASHSTEILADLSRYGAVLLRGFDVKTTEIFEQTILSIRGMQGMSHFFMSEPGRVAVDNLKYVYHTNTKVKTGGGMTLGGFHNENYYSPDVPSYISFFCLKPPKRGGETGLIHMGKVYEKLDAAIKEKLEKKAFIVARWPLSFIADRYKIQKETAQKICEEFGLTIANNDFVVMNKPSVINDVTSSQKKIIQANLCAELPSLNEEILKLFLKEYRGLKWIFHKIIWTCLGYNKQKKWTFMLNSFLANPKLFLKNRKEMAKKLHQYKAMQSMRIGSVFKDEDLPILARLMKENYSGFTWQANDVLLVDNLQVAHAGMPGISNKKHPREIRAMLCNPLKLDYSAKAAGIQLRQEACAETLGEKMFNRAFDRF